jgi:hypothetical protein
LIDKKKEYDDIIKSMQGLTAGTTEWNNKLAEANEEILRLIEAYPLLSKYLSLENGMYTIKGEGFDALI